MGTNRNCLLLGCGVSNKGRACPSCGFDHLEHDRRMQLLKQEGLRKKEDGTLFICIRKKESDGLSQGESRQ